MIAVVDEMEGKSPAKDAMVEDSNEESEVDVFVTSLYLNQPSRLKEVRLIIGAGPAG